MMKTEFKECLLNCEFQLEGLCSGEAYGFDPYKCKAKSDDDLMTEEEFEELNKTKTLRK